MPNIIDIKIPDENINNLDKTTITINEDKITVQDSIQENTDPRFSETAFIEMPRLFSLNSIIIDPGTSSDCGTVNTQQCTGAECGWTMSGQCITCQHACLTICQKTCQCTIEGCESCQSACEVSCQCSAQGGECGSCQSTCQTTCQSICQCSAQGCETCQTTCESYCQSTCQLACQCNEQLNQRARPQDYTWNMKMVNSKILINTTDINKLAEAINNFRYYKYLNAFTGFTTVKPNTYWNAKYYNELIDAILPLKSYMAGSVPAKKKKGDIVHINDMKKIVTLLNSII